MALAERLLELSGVEDGSILDLAVMTQDGVSWWRRDDANTCNNGHSTIKVFVALCIGMLWDEKKVHLEDRAVDFFPALWPEGMDARWQRVTVGHLLAHRCGQAQEGGVGFEEEEIPDGGRTDLLTLVLRRPMAYEPGTHYQYTDDNYYFLARILEKITGMGLDRGIGERLGRPLGFRDFAISIDPHGHHLGGGCMYMRASDMVKVGYLLACGGCADGKQWVSAEWVRRMREDGYGLTQFRGSDVFIKTGAYGQGVAFSSKYPIAAAWHRGTYRVKPLPDRNDTMLLAFQRLIQEQFGR